MYLDGIGYEQFKGDAMEPILRYELRVFADDEEIFSSDYPDDIMLQEDLHKVDRAVENYVAEQIELSYED